MVYLTISIELTHNRILKFICCLYKSLFLGKLLRNFADFPRVVYKLVAYKKNTCI